MTFRLPLFEDVERARVIAEHLCRIPKELAWDISNCSRGYPWRDSIKANLETFDRLEKRWRAVDKTSIGIALRRCGLPSINGTSFTAIKSCTQLINELDQNFRILADSGDSLVEYWASFTEAEETTQPEKIAEVASLKVSLSGIVEWTESISHRIDAEFVGAANWCLDSAKALDIKPQRWTRFKSVDDAANDDRINASRTKIYAAIKRDEPWVRKLEKSQIELDLDSSEVK